MAKRRPVRPALVKPAPRHEAGRGATGAWRVRLLALAIVVAGGWTYATSFKGVFVGDDVEAIVANPHIRSLWPLDAAMSAPPDTTVAGRPVASLTLALNYALAPADVRHVLTPGVEAPRGSPDDPFYRNIWGYHAFNLTVHLLAALTLLGVVRRTLLTGPLRARFGEASTWLAFAIAVIWVVHPLQTQSVTYVVQRVESLMGLLALVTLYGAIRALERDHTGSHGREMAPDQAARRSWWIALSVGACALGMATKESMVGMPIVVTIWIWIMRPEASIWGPAARPLLAGLAATWVLLAWLVAGGARTESVGLDIGGWTWWSYLRTQASVITHYLRLSVWPAPLVFLYGWMPAASWSAIAPAAGLVTALVMATVIAVGRRRPVGFLGVWWFVILAPTSSVLPIATEVAAEHRLYLPVASVIAFVVLGVFSLVASRLAPPDRAPAAPFRPQLVRTAGWLAVAAVAVTFGVLASARNRDYWSVEALLADTVKKRPYHAEVRVGYGGELLTQDRYAEAETQLRAALELPGQPGSGTRASAMAHLYLGSALCAQQKLDEGIRHLEQALAQNPRLAEAHGMLGEAYASQGRLTQAAAAFERAVAALPDLPPLLSRSAWLLATATDDAARHGARAVVLAERAVQLTGGRQWIPLEALAAAYAEVGRFPEALSVIERATMAARVAGVTEAGPDLERHRATIQAGRALRETWR